MTQMESLEVDKAGVAPLEGHEVEGDVVVDLGEVVDEEEVVVRRCLQKLLMLI